MSKRSTNHTRGTMQAWRGMAAEGYPGTIAGKTRSSRPMPQLLGRNSRWRRIAALVAKQQCWTFTDGFVWTYYGGARSWGRAIF